jgi:hypothetical protein
VAVLLIPPAQQKEAAKVSILRFPIWPRLLTYPIPDPILLSDDESVGAESETDYSDLDVDPRAKSDSGLSHLDGEPADGEGFGPGTTRVSGSLATDHPNDGNKSNNGVFNNARLRLSADRPRSASPGHSSVTHRAGKLWVNTDLTQGSTSYVNLDVSKGLDGECSVSAEERDGDGDDTRSTKRSKSSTVSGDNPAFDSNMSELQDGQPDHTRSPQQGLAAASLCQSDGEIGHLPKQLRQRGATGDARRKRPRTPAPTGLASTASTVSASLGSADLEDPQSVALTAALGQERRIHDIDQEMADDRGTDDSNDEDYGDESDAAAYEIGGRPHFRKRVRRAKDTEHNDVGTPSTPSLGVLYQATTATSSGSIQESEEISICGYLTLKIIASKVVYCLTFSQDLPEPRGTSQRQGIARSVSSSSDRRDSEQLPVQERAMSIPARKVKFSREDDKLLLQLKEDGLSWDEISDRFPERSKGTLQVHYSTKLRPRSETSKNTKKRRRSG